MATYCEIFRTWSSTIFVRLSEVRKQHESSSGQMVCSDRLPQVVFLALTSCVLTFFLAMPRISFTVCRNQACQGREMTWVRNNAGRQSPYLWRCPNNHCRRKVYERVGSFFEDGRLPLTKYLAILHFWCHNISVKATVALTQIPERTVILLHKVRP